MMKIIGWITIAVALSFMSATLSGYALSILWEWFVVTTFSLPSISIPVAIGLALIVNFLTHQDSETDVKDMGIGEILFLAAAKGMAKPLLALLIGWIVTLFM